MTSTTHHVLRSSTTETSRKASPNDYAMNWWGENRGVMLNSVEADVCRSHATNLQIISRQAIRADCSYSVGPPPCICAREVPKGAQHMGRGDERKKNKKKGHSTATPGKTKKTQQDATRQTSQPIYYLPSPWL